MYDLKKIVKGILTDSVLSKCIEKNDELIKRIAEKESEVYALQEEYHKNGARIGKSRRNEWLYMTCSQRKDVPLSDNQRRNSLSKKALESPNLRLCTHFDYKEDKKE